ILIPLRAAGVPIMEGAECATAALRNLADFHEFRETRRAGDARVTVMPAPHSILPSGILPTEAAFRLFQSFGIPVTPTELIGSGDAAAAAAERMGFPVALKIESAQITHKSDVGGVALKLASAAEVRRAYAQIHQHVSARAPGAIIDGVVVQRMAGQGVEMIIGVKRDPLFGPVVLCGFGGILVEVLKDAAIGIPPLSEEQARDMIARLRGFSILSGARGKPPADIDSLCDAIVRVSQLALSVGDQLVGLDINPLIVQTHGVVAVDALIEIK
ncbi:MAG: acetate--CoA ligase family protein, partial [Deltaproteobacteria bacterium]|nr:acetate--CoA ligase family protein [Deltaproteobacteria bacterium]